METEIKDLREVLIDAHAHFFFLKGEGATRLRLWQILADSIIVERPVGAPMRRTVLGYLPTLDGAGVYEVEGTLEAEPLPDQMPETIRIAIKPAGVRKINRRRYPRVSFAPPLEGEAHGEGERIAVPVRIINLSAGGLRLETAARLSPSKTYRLRFRIETDDEVHDMNLPGIVAYELPIEAGQAYGMKFETIAEARSPKPKEAPIDDIGQTVDLLKLVNKLIVRG